MKRADLYIDGCIILTGEDAKRFEDRLKRDVGNNEKLQAFLRYQEGGIEKVEKVYPEHKEWVLAHKDKTYNQVKKMLLSS